ncbi:MAG: kelch repeat-containing protein [Candidatus Dormibacteria bacterium]
MAFSQDANAVVIFGGGVDRNSPTDETWLYRTATDHWSQMTQVGS